MGRIVLLTGLLILGLGCAGGPAQRQMDGIADSVAPRWQELAQEGLTALELGARDRALSAAIELQQLRPESPLPWYIRARIKENEMDWATALLNYEHILTAPDMDRTNDWIRLVAGRWVRARRLYDEMHVRATLAKSDTTEIHTGRCLVLPIEPLNLGEDNSDLSLELEVLGVAAAAWVNLGLQQVSGADPVNMHSAFFLRDALSRSNSQNGLATITGTKRPVDAPPITTVLGIAIRLATLKPAGPPPWDGEGVLPDRYLTAIPNGEWTDRKARALAHFQSEHELPPTGLIDPSTRQALEIAFRTAETETVEKVTRRDWTDASIRMGRLLGAEAVLTGTFEKESSGTVRWNVAWISPRNGSLLSEPIGGVLPDGIFADAWDRMIQLIIQASPPCQRSTQCGRLVLPDPPGPEGARDYGYALLLIENEQFDEGVAYFTDAADKGLGERAAWYAMAWSSSQPQLELLERQFYRQAVTGPLPINPTLLRSHSLALSSNLISRADDGMPSAAAETFTSASGVVYLPETAWIHISGTVEGQ
jgi:hypothetical protein